MVKRCVLVVGGCTIAVLVVVLVVFLVVVLCKKNNFKDTFIQDCERKTAEGHSTYCVKVWSAFEQAYVDHDPCQVPPQAYDHLLSIAPPLPKYNWTLFWSGTREVAHQVSGGCYQTLEDTMLGSVLDGKTWCGKQGSNETFDSGCPGWTQCVNNPVRSFWSRASAEFAVVACGDAAVLLNGSRDTPFDPHSTFGSHRSQKFTPGLMKGARLSVVLVTKDNVGANCTDESLKNLQKELKPGIKYICKEKTESELLTCKKNQDQSCVPCW
ncbi:ADP-ribosyl cyclase/cyclic ADP-ribose hydrolase 1-like [Gadus chalcogrammus]|uniref:ADP-ribosyl cyclase/cyclic ADP-ribose hydrolase 1-like n=1 Tax=Gadus chalcogrammus TaxID=1042646 RepID=UPI0024C49B84|nr:ADP-ribosyl cyclase/cyclic ADP-ribose hydrolase 1-like [Gadus chalcogrammus]